jgi:uncharacterized protein (DUF1778 family)
MEVFSDLASRTAPRTAFLTLRVSEEERQAIQAAAASADLATGQFLRQLLRRELTNHDDRTRMAAT